jgi:hypothetical protein
LEITNSQNNPPCPTTTHLQRKRSLTRTKPHQCPKKVLWCCIILKKWGATIPNSRTVLGAGAKESMEATKDLEMAADLAVASLHHVLVTSLEKLGRNMQPHHG